MPPELTSVVIAALDAASTIEAQLAALAEQDHAGPWEVVVADNGSTDGTREIVERWSDRLPRLQVVDAAARRGVAHARNAGVGASHGDFVAMCDADDVVGPTWLRALTEAADRFDVVGGRFDLETLNPSFVEGEQPRGFETGLEVYGAYLPFATTSNCGFRRAVFDRVGGFDPAYRAGEDVDFSWRAQQAGFSVGFAPDGVVAYRFRTGRRARARQFFEFGRSEAQLYRAHRAHGMPRSSIAGGLARDAHLVLRAPLQLHPRTASPDWTRKAATRAGRLVGSLQHRVVYL
jgi:glycosyltransferase involved in cell wall biosynthesis